MANKSYIQTHGAMDVRNEFIAMLRLRGFQGRTMNNGADMVWRWTDRLGFANTPYFGYDVWNPTPNYTDPKNKLAFPVSLFFENEPALEKFVTTRGQLEKLADWVTKRYTRLYGVASPLSD